MCFFLVFNNSEYSPRVTSKLFDNKTMISWKNFLEKVITDFSNKGYSFNHIAELNVITITKKLNISYDFYLEHNMPAVERKITMIIAGNPHLLNSLNRSHPHPLIRKYSHKPFSN